MRKFVLRILLNTNITTKSNNTYSIILTIAFCMNLDETTKIMLGVLKVKSLTKLNKK